MPFCGQAKKNIFRPDPAKDRTRDTEKCQRPVGGNTVVDSCQIWIYGICKAEGTNLDQKGMPLIE